MLFEKTAASFFGIDQLKLGVKSNHFWTLMSDSPQIGLSSFGGISSVILDEWRFVVIPV